MTKTSSVSDSTGYGWNYIRTGPGRSGRSLSENNFAKEKRDWLAILLREVLQNALDARVNDGTQAVSVSLNIKKLGDSAREFINELIPKAHVDRFIESMPHIEKESMGEIDSCLVIEDFGTTGLTGTIDNPDLDKPGENWNAFWFREGEGGKEAASGNGGAGQGKITYFSTSTIRTLFAYTVRADDHRGAIFGSSSYLRDYIHDSVKWRRDAYWGKPQGRSWEERVYLPVFDEAVVKRFIDSFDLERDKHKTGLSLVIPAPKQFKMTDAIGIVIAEFFVPIYRGDLTVRLGATVLNKSTIEAQAKLNLTDDTAHHFHTCCTQGYRDFLAECIRRSKANELFASSSSAIFNDASFSQEDVARMKADLEEQKIVSVRVPVQVKKRSSKERLDCSFEVHLQCPYDLDRPEQAIFRKDLLVGEEPVGGGRFRQRVRGAVFINDSELSRLLLTAEEATHLRWNTKLPRLAEYYQSGPDVVAVVRNAMARLLEFLTGGEQRKDFKLLSKYFSAPGAFPSATAKGKKKDSGDKGFKAPKIPDPQPKALAIKAFEDGCSIRPFKQDAIGHEKLPVAVTAEFAYEGLDKDAFAEYDPLDFDVSDADFTVVHEGVDLLERANNVVKFIVRDSNFNFEIRGFDKNLRLRVRVNYKENADAALVDAE